MFFALDGLCLYPQTKCIKNFSSYVFFMVLRSCNFSDLCNLLIITIPKRTHFFFLKRSNNFNICPYIKCVVDKIYIT